ncbi:DUF1553 domain-containing protein [Rubripirellula sp.]|nr:DUF1553 domain-containing protein [Rubripirellula sp.]MDB4807344.1 DUF1553 domain-containing protein [bacterium]
MFVVFRSRILITLSSRNLIVLAIWISVAFQTSTGFSQSAREQTDFFEKKIRPILVEHCYECHAADSKDVGGKFLIDTRAGMISGGESGAVIVSGKPDESLLMQAMRYDGMEMPPAEKLPASVLKDFEKWIAQGAFDPRTEVPVKPIQGGEDLDALWSFQPRVVSPVPKVVDRSWPRSPLDQFVLARMEAVGLKPTHDAEDRVLVRRIYFDLIGLPPSDDQVEKFVQEHQQHGKQAVENLVDRLIAEPEFGVRWGRHWLDVARYGESNGDDGLGRNATFPHAWRYRDYVIDAINRDPGYDHFLREQIIGDTLKANNAVERNRHLVATGFLALGSKPASAMNSNFAMDVVDDQINVVSTGVLGLSVACARCHDHKHDPIPTRDYYALAGIFSSTQTLYGAAGNEKLTAPPTELHELRSNLAVDQTRPDRSKTPVLPEGYRDTVQDLQAVINESLTEHPEDLKTQTKMSFNQADFAKVKDTALHGEFSSNAESYSISFWFRNTLANDARPITTYLFSRAKLGDKALPGDHLGIGGKHEKAVTGKLFVFNGNDKKKSVKGSTVIPPNSWNHIVLVRRVGTVEVYLNGQLELNAELEATFGKSREFSLARRSDQFAPLQGNVGEFSAYDRALDRDAAIRLHTESDQPKGIIPTPIEGYAMGVREKAKPADIKIHINGDGAKKGASVNRGVLTAYETLPETATRRFENGTFKVEKGGSGRQELVEWLTRDDHPHTARVMVNRIWIYLMGRGIVATPDDFGVYGARPTHPQLLDYLADDFVRQGWSMKQMIRQIVLSRTYQLASHHDADSLNADPDNRWMARHYRQRLDAESLRDSILHVTGRLDHSPQQGSAIEEIDALINWPPGEATNLHRESNHRSIYLCMLRHAPPLELVAFDLPDAVGIAGRRDVTTLPTQTLFLLNSDFVVSQAGSYARKLLEGPQSEASGTLADEARVRSVFQACFQRLPSEVELHGAMEYLVAIDAQFEKMVADAGQRRQRVWQSFCQAMLMTNEFRYVD